MFVVLTGKDTGLSPWNNLRRSSIRAVSRMNTPNISCGLIVVPHPKHSTGE